MFAFVVGCVPFGYEKKLIGGYSLNEGDTRSGMGVFYLDGKYLVGVVPPTVFAVGYDEQFIIAKQHSEQFPEIDRSVTNYYIIPLQKRISKSAEKNVIGPLTEKEFLEKRREIQVATNLDFSIILEDLK